MIGKVLWYDRRDGYGIIESDGWEYYVDSSVLVDMYFLNPGEVVVFQQNPNIADNDTRCAWKVKYE